jgi:hypothetical protein
VPGERVLEPEGKVVQDFHVSFSSTFATPANDEHRAIEPRATAPP